MLLRLHQWFHVGSFGSQGLCDLEVFPNLPEAVCPGLALDESTSTYVAFNGYADGRVPV